jgi:hypothetical protein
VPTLEAEHLSPFIKFLPVLFSLFGSFLGWLMHEIYSLSFAQTALQLRSSFSFLWFSLAISRCSASIIASFFYSAGFFNTLYNAAYLGLYQSSYSSSSKLFDKGYLEILGPFGAYLL